jgi:hypothetical protein
MTRDQMIAHLRAADAVAHHAVAHGTTRSVLCWSAPTRHAKPSARMKGSMLPPPEATVRGEKLVLNFGEGAVNLDLLLPGAEHDARGQVHRRVC